MKFSVRGGEIYQKKWYNRLDNYITIKYLDDDALARIRTDARFMEDINGFYIHTLICCIPAYNDLVTLVDERGLCAVLPATLVVQEIYKLCEEVNPKLGEALITRFGAQIALRDEPSTKELKASEIADLFGEK